MSASDLDPSNGWNAARVALLRECIDKRLAAPAAARVLGVTADACLQKARRSGLHFRGIDERNTFWSPEKTADLKRRHAAGESARAIGLALGTESRAAVCAKIHRLGLSRVEAGPNMPAKPKSPAPIAVAPKVHIFINRGRVLEGAPDQELPPLRTVETAGDGRPWLERLSDECKYPVSGEGADLYSCCATTVREGYCAAHADIAFKPPKVKAKEFIRGLRRYA